MEYPEHLGDCVKCGKPVMYAPEMTSEDPLYPMHAFDQDPGVDDLYHWGCLNPTLFRERGT